MAVVNPGALAEALLVRLKLTTPVLGISATWKVRGVDVVAPAARLKGWLVSVVRFGPGEVTHPVPGVTS